jgi:hypothetical protein
MKLVSVVAQTAIVERDTALINTLVYLPETILLVVAVFPTFLVLK